MENRWGHQVSRGLEKMTDTTNVLILCTGNSARSLIAETLVRDLGREAGFMAFSAGSQPKGEPHPMALNVLAENGHDTSELSSKSWDVYAQPDAPEMKLVITVCGNAANEVCPIWPGHPLQVHWGVPDPAAIEGPAQKPAFEAAYRSLRNRVERLVELDLGAMNVDEARDALKAIHQTSTGATE